MKKLFIFIIFILSIHLSANSQQLISYFSFPYATTYNSLWGVTQKNDTLWVGSDNQGVLYKVTKTGTILDSILTPPDIDFNHGLAWDGTGFWVAEDYRSSGARIYKLNLQGVKVDSIITGSYAGGIGGIALDGNNLWFSVYAPDFTSYPNAYAYKVNLATKQLVDTIPLRGRQVYGIAVKGDTIFYVNDNFHAEQERIYAYRKAVGDTIFSFTVPDPDNDMDPRGLLWDGQYLWMMAYRVGNNINAYRNLYKYSVSGQGSPIIGTNPSTINFGNVLVGQTSTSPLTITNSGSGKLIISSFEFTNPRFGISPSSVPDTINIGASKNYNVSFSPLAYDTTSGQLRINSNDIGSPIKIVNLSGKGVFTGPTISLSVSLINYNNRRINSLSGGYVNITNQGNEPLSINSITFSSQRFSYDTINAQFPVIINSQQTKTIRLWFKPNAANTFSDSAVINSNAVNMPQAKVSLSGTGVQASNQLGDIMWEGLIPLNPNTTSNDLQPKSIKEIPDVNGDGINDIIVATENYWTICFNGNSSVTYDTLWKFNTHFGSINTGSVDWEDAMQIINDINNDGIKDVIIGCTGGNEMVYALSGTNGRKIWEYGSPTTTSDGDINGLRTDKDYNNDNIPDVLIAASGEANMSGRHSVICVNGLNGQVIFNTQLGYNFVHDVENLPNGGVIDYSNNGGPYGIMGFNNSGVQQWLAGVPSTIWTIKRIPDINNDNVPDVVGFYSLSGAGVLALSGATGAQLWTIGPGSSNNGTIMVLDDLNGNGSPDISLSGPQSVLRIDSKTGSILWQTALSSSYIRDIDTLNDITSDSIKELLISTQQPGRALVINGSTGAIIFDYTFGTTISERADRINGLKSIDGNSTNEFVAASRDGRIKCFSGGIEQPIGITNNNKFIPDKFELYQNYPNPFNPVTMIKFDLPVNSDVKVKIYNISGQLVSELINANMEAGKYQFEFDGSGIASGVYFYKLTTGKFEKTMKMILVK